MAAAFQFRLLPTLIGVAGVALALQAAEIWDGVARAADGGDDGDVPGFSDIIDATLAVGAIEEAEFDLPLEPAAGSDTANGGGFKEEEAARFTPEELALLEDLSARRQELEDREVELNLREGLLNAAEQRIDAKIGELESLRGDIQALVNQNDAQEEADIRRLVKIYETMKPRDAANILQELDLDVLLEIMQRMKERATAPILAAMKPETARTVTTEIARRKVLEISGN